MNETLLPTSLVGSYALPNWLVDRKRLAERFPPRVRARELWRVSPEFLDEAQDDTTVRRNGHRDHLPLQVPVPWVAVMWPCASP